jgi:predicted unusual protein kinase regulating ubiquinone biosynthesis (AarF/ABC1/UbiB family)
VGGARLCYGAAGEGRPEPRGTRIVKRHPAPAAREHLTTGRTRRALKVGGLTTQVGGSYLLNALRRPFQSVDERQRDLLDTHLKNAVRLVERSQELKGTFLKLMQMLSMRNDLLPPEVLQILSVVQSDVPPMPFPMIRKQIVRELGHPPEEIFASLDEQAFAAASLGQVHRGRLHTGEEIVVKVQYPGVEATVAQDLKNVKMLLHTFTLIARDVLRQPVDVEEVYRELDERLGEELDYENEARNTARFFEMFKDDEEILLPQVHPELTSRRVLTLSYLDGYKLADILAPGVDQDLKDWVSVKYFRTLWRQVFEFGTLHTDPHPGNYLVTFHPKLAILDFGSIRIFPEEIRKAYLALARALLDRDRDDAADALVILGFIGAGDDPEPMIQMLDIIFEPAYEDRRYDPRAYDSVERAMSAAAIKLEHRVFRSPGHAVFLMRALVGLDSYLQQFGTVTNYHRLFEECVSEGERRSRRRRRASAVEA